MGTKDGISIFIWLKAGKYIFSFCVCGFSPLHVPKISKHKKRSRFSNTVLNFVVMLWSDLILTSLQHFLHLNCVCFYSSFMRGGKRCSNFKRQKPTPMMMTVRHQICLWWCLSVYFSINISRPHFHNDPPSVNHLCTKVQRKTHQAKTSFVLNHHYHYYVLERMNRKISDKDSDRSNFPFSDVKFSIYLEGILITW